MLQPQAGAQVPLDSFGHSLLSRLLSSKHIKDFNPCSSLRLVPECLFEVVTASTAASSTASIPGTSVSPCSCHRLVPMCHFTAEVTAMHGSLLSLGSIHEISDPNTASTPACSTGGVSGILSMMQPQAGAHVHLSSCSKCYA